MAKREWKKSKIPITKDVYFATRYVGAWDSFESPKGNYIDHIVTKKWSGYVIRINDRIGIDSSMEVNIDHLQTLIDTNNLSALESIFIFKD